MRHLIFLLSLIVAFAISTSSAVNAAGAKDKACQYTGVGLQIQVQGAPESKTAPAIKIASDHPLVIFGLVKDSPAAKADIKVGDRILKIDNQSVIGMDIAEAANKIRGQANTPVTIVLQRTGSDKKVTEVSVTLKRASLATKDNSAKKPL